jgi:hypothetical protein
MNFHQIRGAAAAALKIIFYFSSNSKKESKSCLRSEFILHSLSLL